MIVKDIVKILPNHVSEEVKEFHGLVLEWMNSGVLDKSTDFEDVENMTRRHTRNLFVNIASHCFGDLHNVIVTNVPDFSYIPDYEDYQLVTPEHVFDTLLKIDPTVKHVTWLGRGCFGAMCDDPKSIEKILNGKLVGTSRVRIYRLKSPRVVRTECRKRHSFTIAFFVFMCAWVFLNLFLN